MRPGRRNFVAVNAGLMARAFVLSAFGASARAVEASANEWPAGALELIVPFPAGGSMDALARTISGAFGNAMRRRVDVTNTPGASGMLGIRRLLTREADGRTLLIGTIADIVLADVDTRTESDAPRTLADQLVVIGNISHADFVIVSRPGFDANSIDELMMLAGRCPGRVSLAHPGQNTMQFVTATMIEQRSGVELLHIPYSGSAPMLSDVLAGHVDIAILAVTAARPLVETGRLKVIGLLRRERDPRLPSWPVAGESDSLKDVDFIRGAASMFVRVDVAANRVARLREALDALLVDPWIRAAIVGLGNEPADLETSHDPAALAIQRAEIHRIRLPTPKRPIKEGAD